MKRSNFNPERVTYFRPPISFASKCYETQKLIKLIKAVGAVVLLVALPWHPTKTLGACRGSGPRLHSQWQGDRGSERTSRPFNRKGASQTFQHLELGRRLALVARRAWLWPRGTMVMAQGYQRN